ncbi:MAG: hypothetical protein M1358_12460 [Chloroflexi bacterium]|nr:hypothetical protein [Chloroflexota bacterium]
MAEGSLAKKLQIKPGQRVAIINSPPGYLEQLGELPGGTEVADKPDGVFDFVQLFVKNVEELNRLAPAAIGAIKRDGVLWICYPKQSAKIKTDITRDVGWDTVREAGLRPVSLVSIDDVWSALRFRPTELVQQKK